MKRNSSKAPFPKKVGPSVLLEAALGGTLADIKRLIQAGARVNGATRDGFTPLMLAAGRGDPKITAYLIKQGAHVNRRNGIGQTALMIAAKQGHNAIVEQLIAAGADPHAVDKEKRNAIAWATTYADFPELISRLIVAGADYNARDIRGITPLISAALLGHAGAVALLLTAGADEAVKFRGKTAYDMASEKGHEEVCKTMRAVLENRPKGHAL